MKEAAASARTADMFERKGLRRESGAVRMRVMPSVRTPVARKWTKLMLLTEARGVDHHPGPFGRRRREDVDSVRSGEDGDEGIVAQLADDDGRGRGVSLTIFQNREYHRVLMEEEENRRQDEDGKYRPVCEFVAQHDARDERREGGHVSDDGHPREFSRLELSMFVPARHRPEIFRTTSTGGGQKWRRSASSLLPLSCRLQA